MSKFESTKWDKFLEKQGTNPQSSRKFWQRINSIKNGKGSGSTPKLVQNETEYTTNQGKASLFKDLLEHTFDSYDNEFKKNAEEITDIYFAKHETTQKKHSIYMTSSQQSKNYQ